MSFHYDLPPVETSRKPYGGLSEDSRRTLAGKALEPNPADLLIPEEIGYHPTEIETPKPLITIDIDDILARTDEKMEWPTSLSEIPTQDKIYTDRIGNLLYIDPDNHESRMRRYISRGFYIDDHLSVKQISDILILHESVRGELHQYNPTPKRHTRYSTRHVDAYTPPTIEWEQL